MSTLPAMFYLEPGIDTSKLPMGAEFECVFCPEESVGDGWVIMRFRVVRFYVAHNKSWARGVQPISKVAITEAEAMTHSTPFTEFLKGE